MKPTFLPAFQAFCIISSSPLLKNVEISAHPHVYNPSQSFTLTCTVNVSPSNGGYGVGIKLNGTDIGWWTNFNGLGFKWGSKPGAKYIVAGSASYPKFTATILGGYPQTRGVYKCVAYYSEKNGSGGGYVVLETAVGYNTNGSLPPTTSTSIFTVLCLLLLKNFF